MPSQDLAGWVRGRTTNGNSVPDGPLPTVKEISPLSTGEVVKDVFDFEGALQGVLNLLITHQRPKSKLFRLEVIHTIIFHLVGIILLRSVQQCHL